MLTWFDRMMAALRTPIAPVSVAAVMPPARVAATTPAILIVATEGHMGALELSVAVRSIEAVAAEAPQLWVVDGYAERADPPWAIPEVRAYLLQLWGTVRGRLPIERLHPDTRLVLQRCGIGAWDADSDQGGARPIWRFGELLGRGSHDG